jgi:hypothetical protein
VTKYSGIQKIIDVDGMPVVMLPPAAAAAPASQPAVQPERHVP